MCSTQQTLLIDCVSWHMHTNTCTDFGKKNSWGQIFASLLMQWLKIMKSIYVSPWLKIVINYLIKAPMYWKVVFLLLNLHTFKLYKWRYILIFDIAFLGTVRRFGDFFSLALLQLVYRVNGWAMWRKEVWCLLFLFQFKSQGKIYNWFQA